MWPKDPKVIDDHPKMPLPARRAPRHGHNNDPGSGADRAVASAVVCHLAGHLRRVVAPAHDRGRETGHAAVPAAAVSTAGGLGVLSAGGAWPGGGPASG